MADDLISRQKVLKIIDWVHYNHCFSPSEERIFDYLKEFFAECEASTIDPVKHGKWIKNEGRCGWHCSACATDDVYAFKWNSDKGENELQDHYCPNCGARMDMNEDV